MAKENEKRTGFKELTVYKKAFRLAMEIFEVSKTFPKEERYSLTDQVRRSSRSVCSSIAEGYRKRIYKAHFVSKATDADMENSETGVWIDFAFECGYISSLQRDSLSNQMNQVGRLINHMIENPGNYCR